MLDYTHKQYIDENLAPHERAIYLEPRLITAGFSGGSAVATIADIKAENRRFLIIRSFYFAIPGSAAIATGSVTTNKTQPVQFWVGTGPNIGNYKVDTNLIFPGGSIVITLSTDQANMSILYQVVTVAKKNS